MFSNIAYADPGQSHRKRSRTQYTDEQRAILEESFIHGSKYPSSGERMQLESKTGVSEEKISVWFQNRRATEKRKKEQDGGSKESTTTDSELETEDEKQLSVGDETAGEDSEIENTHRHQDNTRNDFKVTYPVEISANTHSDENPPSQKEDTTQAFSRYYQSKIEHIANHPYNTTNQHENIPRLDNQNKAAFNIRLSYATNIPSNTSSYTQQTHSANMDISAPTDVEMLYPEQNISNTHNDTKIHVTPYKSISENKCTERTTSVTSSTLYRSEIENERNLRNNPYSIIKAQRPNCFSTNMSTMIPPPRSDGTYTENPITSLHPRSQVTPDESEPPGVDGQNIPRNVIKQPYPDELHNTIDSNKLQNRKIDGTENQHDNGDVNVPNLLSQRTKPSFMILSLPGGTIAVESTEQCLGGINESQNHPNASKHSDVKLTHTSCLPTNTPSEITMPHSEDTLGLYHGENENSMTMVRTVHLKSYSHDRKPRKRAISATGNMDKKPDVIATDVSSNNDNIIKESKKDIVFAEDSMRSKSSFDDFRIEHKKAKTDEDVVKTSSGTILGNTGLEYRIFGET